MKDIQRFKRQEPPDQEIHDAHMRRSENGLLQMEMDTPLAMQYSKPEAKTVYPQGVDMRFYNKDSELQTTLHADHAVSFDARNIMRANENVVVIDYTNGDTIYLEDIVWRKDDDVIFSNHPVRAVNGQRVTYGDGFSSDGKMTNLRITRQRGVIEFNDE